MVGMEKGVELGEKEDRGRFRGVSRGRVGVIDSGGVVIILLLVRGVGGS